MRKLQNNGHAAFDEAVSGLENELKLSLLDLKIDKSGVQEIRLFKGFKPIIKSNGILREISEMPEITALQLERSIVSLCKRSVHSHQHELSQGFLSLTGGHRAGIAGKKYPARADPNRRSDQGLRH